MKPHLFLKWCAIACLATSSVYAADVPVDLRTRAEASDFRATSSYDQALAYLRRLEALSPYVKVGTFGTSEQGRALPLVIVSRDRAFTAAKARRLAKPIVLIQCGIHAGEIDGKDATLMLLRELALGQRPGILDAMTLLFIPIYNVDGHERVSTSRTSKLPCACSSPTRPTRCWPGATCRRSSNTRNGSKGPSWKFSPAKC